ncbi:hypothetical protein PVAND_010312 [Polypedilum vanderplanki]|uniref:Tubulin-specific chaperone cofactor E-like protein n=1 Tax=Polypedilum vanderplanki TaxID=319348 RepID=A0A9J6CGW4_POLVA|nr:hypothetical protein PVAND_010312 [Polypedilum vanderplanki]
MPTLLEALEEKYGYAHTSDIEAEAELLVSIFVPKRPPRISVPTVLVLNDCGIDQAGSADDLKKKCCTVKELDLAQNKLENWNEVFNILSHMPRIEFVNLSLNRLERPIISPPVNRIDNLRSLVLNNTKLNWFSVEELLKLLPSLEELHLSLNEYTHVLLDTLDEDNHRSRNNSSNNDDDHQYEHSTSMMSSSDDDDASVGSEGSSCCNGYRKTNAHEGVRKLHLNGNPIRDWNEICRLGRVFPKLEALVLADCPLRSVSPSPSINDDINSMKNDEDDDYHLSYEHFQNLQLLNLSNADINSWTDIDRLSKFPALKNLRVQNWKLWSKCDSTEHERRQFVIARLPHIEILNGGGRIGFEEREDAERAFIRFYMEKPEQERPSRYAELIAKHGKIDPLVKIDLRPEKKVQVKFIFEDRIENRFVDVYKSVTDLKHRLGKLFGIAPCKMRLYYVDQTYENQMGPEEMKYPNKQLYSYNIATGDKILIEQKK